MQLDVVDIWHKRKYGIIILIHIRQD